ncbi:MFS transporter [bacterium]|nr:MFS transporter [bacterium]
MINKKQSSELKLFLGQIYTYSFFNELIFIYAFYAVMFSDYGLSAIQISVLLAVWSAVTFILEIPSGALADKYSRKNILLFAQAAKICGYICWMLLPTFWGFLVGFICWGIRSAFSSGSFEAFVFDELSHYKEQDDYARIIGRIKSLSTTAVLVSGLSAALMIHFGYRIVILAGLFPLAISFAAILFTHPAERAESTAEVHYLALLKEGVRETYRNHTAKRLIAFLAFAVVFFPTLEEYWSLFYKSAGMQKEEIAILTSVVSAAMVIAGLVAHKVKWLSERASFFVYCSCGFILLVAAYYMCPISVISIPAICFLWIVIEVNIECRLQYAIESDARATVLSVQGFLSEVMAVVIYLGFGAVATGYGYRTGFMVSAIVIIVLGVFSIFCIKIDSTCSNKPGGPA